MVKIPNEAMTHTGRFHTDDVFSAALLKILNPQINIVRCNTVPEGYQGLIFDLGDGAYDHHGNRESFRENGVRYASFGLLWKKYGCTLVSEKEALTFDESFIQPLDFQDNNGGSNLLCRVITQFNPKWDEENADSDAAFFKAVEFAGHILENEIRSMHSTEHAKKMVLECLKNSEDGIVVLATGMPWKALLIPEDVYYVVYPSARGGYNAQAVPSAVDSQQCKKPFPEHWRGKREELDGITGLKGMMFCHSNGYLLVAETEETAVAACRIAMKEKMKRQREGDY
ncbi:MAG: MYG1 family protein [Lachnospiraceae bacterium]|nr:MYG1 family protein [Lachnospiraceae bacterium]